MPPGDYPTPDGTCIRDYVHVSDLANAHVAAVDRLAAGKPSNSFNLGNGRGLSVAEVLTTSENVTGRAVPTEMCDRVRATRPSLSVKARELLGWTPKFPELDRQMMHALAWFRDKVANI